MAEDRGPRTEEAEADERAPSSPPPPPPLARPKHTKQAHAQRPALGAKVGGAAPAEGRRGQGGGGGGLIA
jgi:hypothetical protein